MVRGLILLALMSFASVANADGENSCRIKLCKVGQQVVVAGSADAPLPACETEALNEYVGFVAGLNAMGTNEKIVTGDLKTIVDDLQRASGVKSFEEAMSHCSVFKTRENALILQIREGGARISRRGFPPQWISLQYIDPAP